MTRSLIGQLQTAVQQITASEEARGKIHDALEITGQLRSEAEALAAAETPGDAMDVLAVYWNEVNTNLEELEAALGGTPLPHRCRRSGPSRRRTCARSSANSRDRRLRRSARPPRAVDLPRRGAEHPHGEAPGAEPGGRSAHGGFGPKRTRAPRSARASGHRPHCRRLGPARPVRSRLLHPLREASEQDGAHPAGDRGGRPDAASRHPIGGRGGEVRQGARHHRRPASKSDPGRAGRLASGGAAKGAAARAPPHERAARGILGAGAPEGPRAPRQGGRPARGGGRRRRRSDEGGGRARRRCDRADGTGPRPVPVRSPCQHGSHRRQRRGPGLRFDAPR